MAILIKAFHAIMLLTLAEANIGSKYTKSEGIAGNMTTQFNFWSKGPSKALQITTQDFDNAI